MKLTTSIIIKELSYNKHIASCFLRDGVGQEGEVSGLREGRGKGTNDSCVQYKSHVKGTRKEGAFSERQRRVHGGRKPYNARLAIYGVCVRECVRACVKT